MHDEVNAIEERNTACYILSVNDQVHKLSYCIHYSHYLYNFTYIVVSIVRGRCRTRGDASLKGTNTRDNTQ